MIFLLQNNGASYFLWKELFSYQNEQLLFFLFCWWLPFQIVGKFQIFSASISMDFFVSLYIITNVIINFRLLSSFYEILAVCQYVILLAIVFQLDSSVFFSEFFLTSYKVLWVSKLNAKSWCNLFLWGIWFSNPGQKKPKMTTKWGLCCTHLIICN